VADAVLDSSAILAVILEEPGADRVEAYLPGGKVSAVNIGEVVAKLRDLGMPEPTTNEVIAGLQLDIRVHDLYAALAAGHLRPQTRSAGLSLGDHACLALAQASRLPTLTSDRSWLAVAKEIGVQVELIR
jgi:ribonuclease VapC